MLEEGGGGGVFIIVSVKLNLPYRLLGFLFVWCVFCVHCQGSCVRGFMS